MRAFAFTVLAVFALSACGHKGSLKSPSQVEKDAAKKAEKDAKKTKINRQENASTPANEEGN